MTNLLIDANHLAYRCKHVFSLSNNGKDVSVTYGFLRVLGSLLDKWKPTSVVVCFDGGIPEYRRRTVPSYKANRHVDEDPLEYEDFKRQLTELFWYAVPITGCMVVKHKGIEADDLLWHASRMLVGDSVVVSGDKDLFQCASNNVSVYNPGKEKLYTVKDVEEAIGLPFNRYLDWRALQGDSSDNIPGVTGIGEKTATKLLREFGDITGVYNAAMGHNPKGRIDNDKIRQGIIEFGLQRLINNIYISALYADRVGSRAAILEAYRRYSGYKKNNLKNYLLKRSFVSLLDAKFLGALNKLKEPEIEAGDLQIPVVYQYQRKALE